MCGVLITEDEGMTYTPHGNIKIDLEKYNKENQQESSEYNSSPHLWEPNCIEAEDGHIIMFMRNSHHCYIEVAESFDYGNNWVHIGSTDIPNADSKICLEKINEKVILVSNTTKSFEFMGRTNLQIQISDDYCKTWKHFSYVNNKEDLYFYPHIAIDKTKSVQLSFSMNKLVINASSPDAGTATQELDIEYNGDATFTINFNVKFLLDVAGQVEGDKFQMEMQESLSPTIIKSTDKDTDALFVLMPMRM